MFLHSNELTTSYPLEKLGKALKLLLNDVPDHQDDTINLKLLDSIGILLSKNSDTQQSVDDFLYEFIDDQILKNSNQTFFTKNAESVCFFLNLFKSLLKHSSSTGLAREFLNRFLKFIQSYLNETDMHSIESSILTSLLELLCVCYDFISNAKTTNPIHQTICDENKSVFTQLLDKHFFNEPSLHLFLNGYQKSIFVRKAFKSLLNKHFFLSFQTSRVEQIEQICLLISNGMSFEMQTFNLDIFEEVLNEIFVNIRLAKDLKLNSLSHILSTLKLSTNIVEILPFLDPKTSKSFCYVFTTDLLIGSTVFEDPVDFKSQFFVQLNQICDYFLSSQFKNAPNVFENVRFDGRFHVFFRCLVDFYLVLNEFLQSKNENFLFSSFKPDMQEIQMKLFEYLLIPFKLSTKFNVKLTSKSSLKQEQTKQPYEEIINSLAEIEQMKISLLKQCLLNLKYLFSKCSPVQILTEYVSLESFIYVLRSLDIKSDIKCVLFEVLAQFLKTTVLNYETNKQFCDHLMEMIKYKFENEKLLNKFYRLLEASLTHLSEENLNDMKMATLINSSLFQMDTNNKKSNEEINKFYLHLNAIVDFICNLIVINDNRRFKLVVRLLSEQDFYLFRLLTRTCCLLFQNSDEQQKQMHGDTEILRNIIDSILKLLQNVYVHLHSLVKQQSNENRLNLYEFERLLTAEFVYSIEKYSLVESEAFMRREILRFLMLFHSYSFKMSLAYLHSAKINQKQLSLDFLAHLNVKTSNSCNYFSYMLINELDWQTQLYCLEYFADLIESLGFLIHNYDFTLDFLSNFSTIDDLHANASTETESQLPQQRYFNKKQFSELNLAEIIFCYSDCFKALIKTLLNDFDQQTIQSSTKILLNMKTNEKFMAFLQQLDQKNNQLFQKEIKSSYMPQMLQELVKSNQEIAVGAYGSIEETNEDEYYSYFRMFLVSLDVQELNKKLTESSLTSDLYLRNPVAILDDIINSYRFDMDQEKSIDCY